MRLNVDIAPHVYAAFAAATAAEGRSLSDVVRTLVAGYVEQRAGAHASALRPPTGGSDGRLDEGTDGRDDPRR
jgi:hypothetical protein